MDSRLTHLMEPASLRRLAGNRYFERGQEYFALGRVSSLARDGSTVVARVDGTEPYEVRFWLNGKELAWSCTCPVGDEGTFCKHCVAAAMAALEGTTSQADAPPRRSMATMDEVRTHLGGLEKGALVELLVTRAMRDEPLRELLLLRAARDRSAGKEPLAFKEIIDRAVDPGEFVDWDEVPGYSERVEEVIDILDELLAEGRATDVVELSEHALVRLEEALELVDDPSGRVSMFLGRLQELHLAACEKARLDPEALAERLLAMELRSGFSVFTGAVERYSGVLGAKGRAAYWRQVEAEWSKLPPLGPNAEDPARYGRRFRLSSLMEAFARKEGEVEALVAVLKKDLSRPDSFLEIAEAYREAKAYDLALEWAERGRRAFPKRVDAQLRQFLAEEYHRRKRHDEAMALIWAGFTGLPQLAGYQELKAHADRSGSWGTWRERALGWLRMEFAEEKRRVGASRWLQPNASTLVEVLLWEKDVDAAWKEAQAGGCSVELWLQLAREREAAHPEDAVGVYQKQIEAMIRLKNNGAYASAMELLHRIQRVMARLGREDEFKRYLESIRAAHGPKRNLMRLLAQARWE